MWRDVRHLKVIASHMDCLSMLVSLGPVWSRITKVDEEMYIIWLCYYRPQPQGKVMFSEASVSQFVHNWPHGYSVTAHPCYGVFSTHPAGMLIKIYLFSINRRRHVQMYVHVCELIWKSGTWVTLNKPVPTCPENEHQRESIPCDMKPLSVLVTLQYL